MLKPLKDANLKQCEVKSLGFQATSYMWHSCNNENERNKGGRIALNQDLKLEIQLHMESLSSIAANRYLKKLKTNAFYRRFL